MEDIDAADREEITTEPGETCVDLTYSAELTELFREFSDIPLTEITEEDRANGIVSIFENPDGTLTIRFTEQGFENYKADLKEEIFLGIDETKCISNAQTEFIDDIVCSNDLSDINIKINNNFNPEVSSEALDEAILNCWVYAFTYNLLIGEDNKEITLSVTDSATGEVLYTF